MGAASYNRGSKLISDHAAVDMLPAIARNERQAQKDEVARLRQTIASLERDLRRARRCLAAERFGREQLRLRLQQADSNYDFAVRTLCKKAFPVEVSA